MKQRSVCIGVCVGVFVLLASACGGSAGKASERALTQDEASTLAQTSYLNLQNTGAVFQVNTVTAPGQATLQMLGMIDWQKHTAMARVSTGLPQSTLTEFAWMSDIVGERRPTFDGQLAKYKAKAPYFIVRKPDMNRRLDQVAAVITGLASEQPENAQLILQKEGSAYLRDDSLRGKDVSVMRYGNRNVFWIEKSTGLLMRFEGSNESGSQQIVIDLMNHGKQKVGFPAQEYWIDAESHPDVMSMTSNF